MNEVIATALRRVSVIELLIPRKRYAEAEAQCRAIIAALPGFGGGHSTLALVLTYQHRLDEAAASIAEAMSLDPTSGTVYQHASIVAVARGDLAHAEELLRKRVALEPDQYISHLNLGDRLAATGQVDEARACYERALSLAPTQPQPLRKWLDLVEWRNQPDDVRAKLLGLLRDDPQYADAFWKLGQLELEAWKLDDAARLFEQSLRLNPDHPRASLAHGLLKLGREMRHAYKDDPAEQRKQEYTWGSLARGLLGHRAAKRFELSPASIDTFRDMLEKHRAFVSQQAPTIEPVWERTSLAGRQTQYLEEPLPGIEQQVLFVHYHFRDLSLDDVDLSITSISESVMEACTWNRARFVHSMAVECTLRETVFEGCAFYRCDFSDTVMEGVTFSGCDLRRADFERVTFRGCAFVNCDARGASFVNAKMERCTMERTDVEGARRDGLAFDRCEGALFE